MKQIEPARPWRWRLLVRVCGRGDEARGRALAEDVAELYGERRARNGRARALLAAARDVVSLALRPAVHRQPPAEARAGGGAVDLSQALRSLRRRPFIGLAAFATTAVGLALATLTFVVVRAVLLDPLPYPRDRQLLNVFTEFRPESGHDIPRSALSWPELFDYGAQTSTMDIAGYLPASVALSTAGGEAQRLSGARMSSRAFDVLGVEPALGRTLDARHDERGGPCGVVLSDGLWRDRFSADAGIVGASMTVDGRPCEVTGVMPPGFEFPSARTRAWVPFPIERDPDQRGSHGVLAIGRLREGHTLDAAEAESVALMTQWAAAEPHHRGHGIRLTSLRDAIVGDVRPAIVVAAASVALVLVIMIANVAGLFLAGGVARRRELAVRAALGADRPRLIRQLGWEVMIVMSAGGTAGIAAAALAIEPLIGSYPGLLPRVSAVAFDARAAAAMFALTIGTALAVAAVPAWRLTGRRPSNALGAGDRSDVPSARRPQLVLVAGELALSVAVTIGALLLLQSLRHILAEPLGFDPRGVLTAGVSAGGDEPRATAFFRDLRDRVRRQPGVSEAGVISAVPLVTRAPPDTFMIDGRPIPAPGQPGPLAHYIVAGPGALEALGVRVRRGRLIGEDDVIADMPVAVVNDAVARRYWPGEDAMGRRFRYPTGIDDGRWTSWTPWITIVGIVEDVRSVAPATPGEPAIYVSYAQRPRAAYDGTSMQLVTRATRPALSAETLRGLAQAIDPRAVVEPAVPLEGFLRSALARPRFMSGLLGSFAAATVSIAFVGIFALASHLVATRRREFGVRLALGATRAGVFGLVIRQLAGAMAIALPAGLAIAWALARWMESLLHGISAGDPWTYAGVTVALSLAVVVATAVPARRAMRIDPLASLRAE